MIILRKASYSDCELFNRWENDEEVIRFLSISKNRSMEESIREFIAREQDESVMDFLVLSGDVPIGRAFLSRYDQKNGSIDITRIYIGEAAYRGRGLGYEMMRALNRFCFEELGLHRVTLDFYDGNPAQSLYRSLGYMPEGVARDAGYKDGRYHNFNLMSLLRHEWEKSEHR